MNALASLATTLLLLAAAAPTPPAATAPKAQIPAALHGCWHLDERGDEAIGAFSKTLTVSATGS